MEGNPKTAIGALLVVACFFAVLNEGSCCGNSWIRYGDNCYKIFSTTLTRYSARIKCFVEGSDLASISNASVLDLLAQHTAHAEISKFWVGLLRKPDGRFVWIDGKGDVKQQPWVKVDNYPGNNRTSLISHGCFAYDGVSVKINSCIERIGVICSHEFTGEKNYRKCHWYKKSYIGEATGNCLFRETDKVKRNEVNEMCQRKGAYFVDIDDIFKDGLTALYTHNVLPNDGSKFWTGLTWNGTHLIWSNGHHVPLEYTFPVVEGSGSCVTVQFNFTGNVQVQFYQTECDDEAQVVCAEPTDGFSTSTTVPPTSDLHDFPQMDDPHGSQLTCPEGYNWKSDRTNQYCFWETSFETEQLSWDNAENYCKGFGGHLGSFHSQDEEKIGLSFQYGSLAHPYWIGLSLDVETETYKWSDGTPLDYQNWAPGHPDHKDKQLRCVAMEAQAKHWVSSLCGILSWFICKVPQRVTQPVPVLPTPPPLEPCDRSFTPRSAEELTTSSGVVRGYGYERGFAMSDKSMARDPVTPAYFQGACYFVISEGVNWHRAKQHCENEGATLASIHSGEEIGFLLRLLHDAPAESNRVWIGLNSFGSDGNFRWTDWTGVDFTFFSENEPDNYKNQEKCCNMNTKNGEWSDENCNAVMGFICKRRNDTSGTTTVPTTIDPRIGNCKKGWIAHNDRCYYLGGKRKKDRVNWTVALDNCLKEGGYLTSIRDETDQNFLAYLLQMLGGDAWIGLHDTIQSGRYYWLDNSEVRYTNWAPGEPSFFGVMEDCVKLVYDHLDSGVWKDEECNRELGYICQNSKDPKLPPAPYERGVNCIHPEGWLKLENMCFKMFGGSALTWERAEQACKKEGGHLVSVSDQKVKAVVSYLASEVNQPFFIGLKYQKDSQTVRWLNEHAVMVTNWEKNEPSFLTENTCFASTSEGYWKKASCQEEMPYVCQITTGKPQKLNQYTGECPPSSTWKPGSNSYCYMLDGLERYDWFTSNLMCFRYGSHLASIHSMSEIEDIKKLMKPGIRSLYIGLMKNKKGGFTWMDDSPVDFVNWDENEPSNSEDQCVEMMADSMKWKVTPCLAKKYFVCMDKKTTLVVDDPQTAGFVGEKSGLSTPGICAVVAGILVGVVIMVAAALYRRRSSSNRGQFRRQFRDHSISFENALYNVGSASMEFHDDKNQNDL